MTLPIRICLAMIAAIICMFAATAALPSMVSEQGKSEVRASTPSAAADRDDVAATERSVVRVVTVVSNQGEVVRAGSGSGFAIAPNRIVTNAHVVSDAEQYPDYTVIGLVPSEGAASRRYRGRLIRLDRSRDLALVEIIDGEVPAASIFTGQVPQRETIFALGYPGNVDLVTVRSAEDFLTPRAPLASDGIVSSRNQVNGVEMLVHDADIARGNSGGPLVDGCGRVVGVNTAISRADDGDSPFSFALSARELTQFLTAAGQRFGGVASDCVSWGAVDAQRAGYDAEEARKAAEITEAVTARNRAREQELGRLQAAAQDSRETIFALAVVLFGTAILSGAAAFMYAGQNKSREQQVSMVAAALLAIAALVLFLMRPNPADVRLSRDYGGSAAKAAVPVKLTGQLACTVDRSRSRITVSSGIDTAFAMNPNGCVNDATQYVRGADGVWSKTLLSQPDATVTRVRYDEDKGISTVENFFMARSAMESIAGLTGVSVAASCTANADRLGELAARERAIAAQLPSRPNEEIVSQCRAAEQSAISAPGPVEPDTRNQVTGGEQKR